MATTKRKHVTISERRAKNQLAERANVITSLNKRESQANQLRAFTAYILARMHTVAMESDPGLEHIESLAARWGVQLSVKPNQERLYEVFDRETAYGIELLLTGNAWSEAEAQNQNTIMLG